MATNQAAGVVSFDTSNDIVITAPIAGAPAASSTAVVRISRGPGVYGIVNVPFLLVSLDQNGPVTHVLPSSGVVTLLDQQVPVCIFVLICQDTTHVHGI